ncbi:MAG: ROK family protein [Planctomycetaceae bacterium]
MSTSHIQPGLLRKMTVRRILEVLHTHGPASRAELTRHTGISAPTVSKAVATLMETGLVEDDVVDERGMGRPARRVRLATDRTRVVGVVLDSLECIVASAGLDGLIDADATVSIRTPSTYKRLIQHVSDTIADMALGTEASLLGIGVSIPGLVNSRTQQAVLSPNLRITNGQFPARDLADRLGCEAIGMQETHALCLAERDRSRNDPSRDFAMVDATTGLGLGIMTAGKLLLGHGGLAGELGHITVDINGRLCGCGNRGCVETLATDTALATLVSERLGTTLDFDQVQQLVDCGEVNAAAELQQTTDYLAVAIAAAINLLNPSSLCIHARFLNLQDGLFEHLIELIRRRTLTASFEQCQIRRALGNKQQGAISAIIHHLTTTLGPLSDEAP